jgi:hypothetical protein
MQFLLCDLLPGSVHLSQRAGFALRPFYPLPPSCGDTSHSLFQPTTPLTFLLVKLSAIAWRKPRGGVLWFRKDNTTAPGLRGVSVTKYPRRKFQIHLSTIKLMLRGSARITVIRYGLRDTWIA